MSDPSDTSSHRHEHPDDRKARIAAAWAELVAAASTDPKARAFLAAFGSPDGAGHGGHRADAGSDAAGEAGHCATGDDGRDAEADCIADAAGVEAEGNGKGADGDGGNGPDQAHANCANVASDHAVAATDGDAGAP